MALSDISLTAGMRGNLLSLQSTSTLLDRTQTRLSTGKKVNTALDNPTNFFSAQANNQRANDLSTRKDAMSEAVQGVQAANQGITGITALIEAAKGLTQAAQSADSTNRNALAAQFNTVLTQISQLANDSGYKGKNFLQGDTLNVLFNENGSSSLAITGFDATASGMGITALTIASTTATTGSVPNAVSVINVVTHTASLAPADQITGYVATGTFDAGAGALIASGGNVSGATESFALTGLTGAISGYDSLYTGAVTVNTITVSGVVVAQFNTGGALVTGFTGTFGTAVATVSGASGALVVYLTGALAANFRTGAAINFNLTVNAHMDTGAAATAGTQTFNLATGDIGSGLAILTGGARVFVSGVYLNPTGNYTVTTGRITFAAGIVPPSAAVTYSYNQGFNAGDAAAAVTNQTVFTGATLGTGQAITSVLVSGVALTTGFTISGQYITLTTGVASGTAVSYLTTTTVTGGWESDSGISTSVNQLNTAIDSLRTQSANLASNLNVVNTRQDFTNGMIAVLQKGADNLTLADMNEEGANMLMLQTRQQLGTTSLKMASDAAQSVLRLF